MLFAKTLLAKFAFAVLTIALLASVQGCSAPATPAALAKRGNYAFWPAAPDMPHIQFLTAINSSRDIAPAHSGFEQMVYGREADQSLAINKPYGVRMWNGRIYVCDIRSKGLTVLDLRQRQTRIMGATGNGTLTKAIDLAIAPDGTKYVVDASQSAVVVFNADERFVNLFQLPGSNPVGIAVHDNLLYVTDFKAGHVKVLDRNSGKELRTIGEKGGEDGQFIGPLAVACDKQGNVYVTDTLKARIQKFSPEGKLLLAYGEAGDRPGNFVRPKHIGVCADGEVHIVDAAFNNIQVFDADGKVVGFYGSRGNHPGAMDLPAGLEVSETDMDLFEQYIHPAFEAERLILVTNQFGPNKISVFAQGHLRQGKSLADISPMRADVTAGTVATTQPTTGPTTSTSPAAFAPSVAAAAPESSAVGKSARP